MLRKTLTALLTATLLAGGIAALPAAPAHAGGSVSVTIVPKGDEARIIEQGLQLYALSRDVRNRAKVKQRGADNAAAIGQSGSGNWAGIFQRGKGHTATIDQTGNNNAFAIFQFGKNTSSAVTQQGNGGAGLIFQGGW